MHELLELIVGVTIMYMAFKLIYLIEYSTEFNNKIINKGDTHK
jgi:hypothetical protein